MPQSGYNRQPGGQSDFCDDDFSELVQKFSDFLQVSSELAKIFKDVLESSDVKVEYCEVQFGKKDESEDKFEECEDEEVNCICFDDEVTAIKPPPKEEPEPDCICSPGSNACKPPSEPLDENCICEPESNACKDGQPTQKKEEECVEPEEPEQPEEPSIVKDCDCGSKSKQKKQPLSRTEKLERLRKLQESITCTQQYLANFQEEVRQIERRSTDFDSKNTPDGKVNPAALYREIMRTDSICAAKPSHQETSKSPSDCRNLLRTSSARVQFCGEAPKKEKISVLSAVPFPRQRV